MNLTTPEFGLLPNPVPESPNSPPGWQKCLSCDDLGNNCNGPSIRTIGNIESARSYHKALRKARKIHLKQVAEAAPSISENTVNEYFSNAEKDYKWSTVFAIDNALVSICGNRVGLPPLSNACPSSSAEIRAQLAAADLKVAEANLKVTQTETTVVELQNEIIDVKKRSADRIDQMQSSYSVHITWMQKQMILWQCFAFTMAAVLIIMLIYHAH